MKLLLEIYQLKRRYTEIADINETSKSINYKM